MLSRAIRLAGLAFSLLLLSGCFVPYVYPTFSYLPPLAVDGPADEIHVFRVDWRHEHSCFRGECHTEQYERVTLKDATKVPGQFAPGVTSGATLFCGALNYDSFTESTILLRLYRPGYDLVEIAAGSELQPLVWVKSTVHDTQDEALDRLFPVEKIGLFPKDAGHRAALAFGISEYERLARTAETEFDKSQLEQKAERLRKISAGSDEFREEDRRRGFSDFGT